MDKSTLVFFMVCLSLWIQSGFAQPTVDYTEFLGPLAGLGATLHPNNSSPEPIEFYGTDLGFSYVHNGRIHFLFGDTVANPLMMSPIEKSSGRLRDDAFGWVDLREWSDSAAFSPDNVPVLELAQNPGTKQAAALDPGMVMDGLKTPEGGFSNGEREFAVFFSAQHLACTTDSDCGSHLSCDGGLGSSGEPYVHELGITWICLDGDEDCSNNPLQESDADSGFCVDKTSSVWSDSHAGRTGAAAWMQRIGVRALDDPRKYATVKDWWTTKFYNIAVSTVDSFVPAKGPGHRNQDYNIVAAPGDAEQKVLLWGRPGFVGVSDTGRSLGLYFAYVDMPRAPAFNWAINYFTGTDDDGVPRFSTREEDAKAVDLDSTQTGVQPEELHDLTGQMSIVWVNHLNKWLMFYGGGVTDSPLFNNFECGLLGAFVGSDCYNVRIGNGAIRMRTADDPWGPWSPPQDVLVGGDPKVPGSGQFGPGGILRHPACEAPDCAPHSNFPAFRKHEEYGYLYAPNIVQPWIRPVGEGVEVVWNVSTWDPYRVVLMRTRIKR